MKQQLKKSWLLITLLVLALATLIINQFPYFIEHFYSTGLYPYISRSSRFLFGWIPFSLGDVVYAIALIWIIIRIVNLYKRWRRKQLNRSLFFYYCRNVLQAVLVIYIAFNWLWGFNYNRLGSAYQMQLKFQHYSTEELTRLTDTLAHRLVEITAIPGAGKTYGRAGELSLLSAEAYQKAEVQFPFLHHPNNSVKPQLLYSFGNYIGFLGYFNPFTSEAQLNTTIPKILLPVVCCHEMAHQLGYASESEANFIGYITCRQSPDASFRYSAYFDLFSYTISDLYFKDSLLAREKIKALPQKIKDDRKQVRSFFDGYKNPFSPLIEWVYDKYLKLNSQPKGRHSYNEVVGWMIAYASKYGWDKI